MINLEAFDGQIVIAGLLEAYIYRDSVLANYSLYEFCGVMQVVLKKESPTTCGEDHTPSSHSRPCNSRFPIHPNAGLLAVTHEIQIRSKFYPPPPNYPVGVADLNSPEWTSVTHKFAQYALVVFRPWNVETREPGPLHWVALNDFLHQCLISPTHRVISIVRREWIFNISQPLSIKSNEKRIIEMHRFRNVRKWGSNNPDPEALMNPHTTRISSSNAVSCGDKTNDISEAERAAAVEAINTVRAAVHGTQ